MNRLLLRFPLIILSLIGGFSGHAQVLPVGLPALEDYYRREQLMGRLDSSLSFSIRPLSGIALQRQDLYHIDLPPTAVDSASNLWLANNEVYVQLQPLFWQQQINSKVPYGWNDGAMIPAKGYQTFISGGVFAKYKFLTVQLRPEIVLAGNGRYEGFGGDAGPSQDWYNSVGNVIDMPERFGNSVYTKIFWGQSSVKLNFDPIAFGISTENLWWGPGRYNSLTMTNNAPGFTHLTLNTTKPIQTGIGSFEAQLVVGRLDSSGYAPSLLGDGSIDHHALYAVQKPDTWRYFSGLVFTYQPKWLSGLSLGMIRTMVANRADMGHKLGDFLPYLGAPTPLETTDENGNIIIDERPRDQYASVFFRFMMPKGHMEFYGEYGRRDKPKNGRDLLVQADYARAYVLGFRKLIDLKSPQGDLLEIGAEATELASSNTIYQRGSRSWYTHPNVRHGYTNKGQVLGAGIGPGSTVQTVNLSWIRGIKQIGLQFERLSHNEDLFYWNISDIRRQWSDLSVKAYGVWDFKPIIATASLQYIRSYNYQYKFEFPEGVPNNADNFWNFTPQRLGNWQARLGLMYQF